ncbi:MAG: hypothetical protein ACT4N5_05435 [Nitrosopumilaceae archaeon]
MIGIIILVFGFGSFALLSYLLDYGYLNNFLPTDNAFMYARVDLPKIVFEVNQWGWFAYLRLGFLITGFAGIGYITVNGLIILFKRKKDSRFD